MSPFPDGNIHGLRQRASFRFGETERSFPRCDLDQFHDAFHRHVEFLRA